MKRIATTMKMMFKLFHTQKPKLSGDILCTVVLLCWHYFILSFLHNTCLENYAIVYTKATNLEQNNSLLMVLSDSKKKYSSRQKADYFKRLKLTIYFRELWNIKKNKGAEWKRRVNFFIRIRIWNSRWNYKKRHIQKMSFFLVDRPFEKLGWSIPKVHWSRLKGANQLTLGVNLRQIPCWQIDNPARTLIVIILFLI